MLYLDTSLIVAAAAIEAETARVQAWFDCRRTEDFTTSEWALTEYSAAFSIKLRMKTITTIERDEALVYLEANLLATLELVAVCSEDFRQAAKLADSFELGLRGGDALHLAVAARLEAELCTLDKGQAKAGEALGIRTQLV